VVDDECLRTATLVHNTSEHLFRLCANTDPQRDSLFIPQSRDLSDVLDHATSDQRQQT
jgi:4-hydroxy-3-polyprenylbenzoate decarboxylase